MVGDRKENPLKKRIQTKYCLTEEPPVYKMIVMRKKILQKKLLALLLFPLLLLLSVPVRAQQSLKVKGKVIHAITKSPLSGISVMIRDSKGGSFTDAEGHFEITVPSPKSILVFTAIGFEPKEAPVEGLPWLEVALNPTSHELAGVTVVGSRNLNRTALNTPVPVDIIDYKTIALASPQIDLNQSLTYLAPSFNSVRQSSSDGTEHIDPASLRGLGPDQTLVLVNGKRRHTTSLLNNQGTFGNGSVGTDLNAIPSSSIDHIEILRDGAAAQYGSDAIAGVINIVLKKNTRAFTTNITSGLTGQGDGKSYDVNFNYGRAIGKNGGYLNASAEFLYRGKTTRTQEHDLIIFDQSSIGNYFAYPFANDAAQSRRYDDSVLSAKGQKRSDYNFQIGDAQIKNANAMYNLSIPIRGTNARFYSFGGFNFRNGEGFGFRRLPSETSNMAYSIFPDGFQPNTGSAIWDGSIAAGVEWKDGGWNWDLSNTFGDNRFDYSVNHAVNASLQDRSPTSFKAGGHEFSQNTVNLDASHYFGNVLAGLNLALGAEFRVDHYTIRAGEEASWKNYGLVTHSDGTTEDTLGLSGGSQSFPGFSPANATNKSRNNASLYADGELDITKNFMIGGAARFEHYSDFGSTLNGKFDTRLKLSQGLAIRGAISSGFRAPSLQQQYFSYVSTDLVNGKLAQSGFFANNSVIAQDLGIPKLKQETSVNASLGLVITPASNLRITLDGYLIDIHNRIVLTGNFGQDAYGNTDSAIQQLLLPLGANTARFFTNAVSTRTAGLDLVIAWHVNIPHGKLDLTLSGNYNDNEVGRQLNIPPLLASQPDIYFSPAERSLIETINPKAKVNFSVDYGIHKWNIFLRNVYFGTVTRSGFPFGEDQVHKAKVVTDLSLSYAFSKAVTLTAGANNILNIFPDKQIYDNSYYGVFKYAPVQMGTTGAFYFLRFSHKLPSWN